MGKEEFVKVDLHIHTPASSCYKGKKDDEEYLRILRAAKKNGLRVIAITDHNSVTGYRSLLQLKSKLLEAKCTLSEITDSGQIQPKLAEIDKKLSLFADILILPGIEFEVSNGIHFLVIFSESVGCDQLQRFLIEGGYDEETFGREEPTSRAKWDVFALYEQAKKYDCITIDAHTDSSKGIWNTIPNGRTRAECFRDPQLCAVGYKNEVQKDKIASILNTAQEYKRTTPFSFVRFSDAHECGAVGSQVTWVKLKDITFASLREAFANPTELVSTESPSLDEILNLLIKEEIALGIPDLGSENLVQVRKLICAMNNSSGGHLLFGVSDKMSKIGLSISENDQKQLGETLGSIAKCFSSVDGPPFRKQDMRVNVYPLQNNRVILSVQVPRGTTLASIRDDGRIYSLRKKRLKVLSGPEIEAIVEERTSGTIENRISKRMVKIEKHCQLVRAFFASIPIIRRFESNGVRMPVSLQVCDSVALNPSDIHKLKSKCCNGSSRGNIFFLREEQAPRLQYGYLRYTVPLFNLRNIQEKVEERETVYIVPGGGVYYSKRNYPFFGEGPKRILKLHLHARSSYALKFIAAYLKSSFLLWYVLSKLDETDLYLPHVYRKIVIPKVEARAPEHVQIVKEIEGCVEDIMTLERTYLAASQELAGKRLCELTGEHNAKVDPIAYKIDRAIFQLVGLSTEEIHVVESHLKLSDTFLPMRESTPEMGT